MILDASAILAMVLREEEAESLFHKVRSADTIRIGAPTLVETTVVLVGRKGRHPAGLNLGDCMSYATARIAKEPLLFVGDDFAKTDIPPA